MSFFKKHLLKLSIVLSIACFVNVGLSAEKDVDLKKGFQFETVKKVKTTSVKNQAKTGTCWTFATNSFMETEVLRLGGEPLDISEMFVVRETYPLKAAKYVRMHGNATLGSGGLSGDVMRAVREFGVVPESVYNGEPYGATKHNHIEMDAVLKASLDAVINNRSHKISKAWPKMVEGILNAYLGEIPETFVYEGKTYTPKSFAKMLGIHPDDYVQLTSYKHHPFNTSFSLEIPDNWEANTYYNIPLDELMQVINTSIDRGFSVAWDGDVSEKSFGKKKGVAILPVKEWNDRSKEEKEAICDGPEPEINVTQKIRQEAFDNYTSTDDHLMHITGIAKDQNDTRYYITKNSWGTKDSKYNGYVYMSEPYVKCKTIAIMVHKDALPKDLRARMGL